MSSFPGKLSLLCFLALLGWGWLSALAGPALAGPGEAPGQHNSGEVSIRIGSDRARVISALPQKLYPVDDNVLANFAPREVAAPGGVLRLRVEGPTIVEEYPFAEAGLRHNSQFGATLAGQVVPALGNMSEADLQERQRRILFMISLAGVGIARDFQSYDTIRLCVETQPGVYSLDRAEFALDTAHRLGISYIARLGLLTLPEHRAGGPPPDERAYQDYLTSVVRRFHDRVLFWSTLKEPEPGPRNRIGNDPRLSPEQVVRILQISYQAVKAVDPRLQVYFPGLGPFNDASYTMDDYLERIIALGGARYFDIMGYDAFVFDIVEAAVHLDRLLRKYGYSKPLWAAQTGVPDSSPPGPIRFRGGGSPEAQGEYLVKNYTRAFYQGVQKVFWGDFMDGSRAENAQRPTPWDATGLFFTGTWEVKPAFHTHRLLATMLDQYSQVDKLGEKLYRFSFPDRSPVYVLWP